MEAKCPKILNLTFTKLTVNTFAICQRIVEYKTRRPNRQEDLIKIIYFQCLLREGVTPMSCCTQATRCSLFRKHCLMQFER